MLLVDRQDNDRSFTILNRECGTVRVGKANYGLSLTVEFSQVIWHSKLGGFPSWF